VVNNIGYGRPDATPEHIREAARDALAEEFILAMPQGYDTMIASAGKNSAAVSASVSQSHGRS
jgi:ABC-type multidrug transport system fused ATPase/permease subunit